MVAAVGVHEDGVAQDLRAVRGPVRLRGAEVGCGCGWVCAYLWPANVCRLCERTAGIVQDGEVSEVAALALTKVHRRCPRLGGRRRLRIPSSNTDIDDFRNTTSNVPSAIPSVGLRIGVGNAACKGPVTKAVV